MTAALFACTHPQHQLQQSINDILILGSQQIKSGKSTYTSNMHGAIFATTTSTRSTSHVCCIGWSVYLTCCQADYRSLRPQTFYVIRCLLYLYMRMRAQEQQVHQATLSLCLCAKGYLKQGASC